VLAEIVERHAHRWEGAACISYPTEWWDGCDTGSAESDARHLGSLVAKAICKGCPIRERCLREAMAGDYWGVWGGTTRMERIAMTQEAS
jgi:WhiB family transcriptional regulator, redox-sensing transcriptional regulator